MNILDLEFSPGASVAPVPVVEVTPVKRDFQRLLQHSFGAVRQAEGELVENRSQPAALVADPSVKPDQLTAGLSRAGNPLPKPANLLPGGTLASDLLKSYGLETMLAEGHAAAETAVALATSAVHKGGSDNALAQLGVNPTALAAGVKAEYPTAVAGVGGQLPELLPVADAISGIDSRVPELSTRASLHPAALADATNMVNSRVPELSALSNSQFTGAAGRVDDTLLPPAEADLGTLPTPAAQQATDQTAETLVPQPALRQVAEPLVPQPALRPANPGNIQDADLPQGVSMVDDSGREASVGRLVTPELDRSARLLDAMPGRTVEAGQSGDHIGGPVSGTLRQAADPLVPQPTLRPANQGNIQDAHLPQGVSTVDSSGHEASVGRVVTPELDHPARLFDAIPGRTAEAGQAGNNVAGVLRQMAEPLVPQPALRPANPGNILDADLPQGMSTVDGSGREASVGRVVPPELDRPARSFDAMPGRTAEAGQPGSNVTQANQFRETLLNAEAQTRGAPPAQESLTAARNAPAEPAPASVTTAPAQSNPVAAATPAAPGVSQTQQSALAALLNVPLTPSKPGWEQDMGTRISYLLKNNQSVAELKLSPASLGTIEVRISGDSERTEVSFFSQNPATRELIEANLPRLRETFANSGIALADVDVSGESLRDHREEQAAAKAWSGVPGHESDENSDPGQATNRGVTLVGDHVVDTFI